MVSQLLKLTKHHELRSGDGKHVYNISLKTMEAKERDPGYEVEMQLGVAAYAFRESFDK